MKKFMMLLGEVSQVVVVAVTEPHLPVRHEELFNTGALQLIRARFRQRLGTPG